MIARLASVAILAAASAAFTAPAQAVPLRVDIAVGPPAPRGAVIPVPRPGWVWAPGYWDWRRGHHYWVGGTWVRERHGYFYHRPEWVNHGGHWHLNRGGWTR